MKLEGQPLHVRLRPLEWGEVIGQEATVVSLTKVLQGKDVPHAFLLTGPSGVGKTTIARLIASAIGTATANLYEVDAATHSGVEDMRELVAMSRYAALGANPTKFFIVDECHALSKATWQSLLLSIEEAPKHAYWCFCTTEADKVPKTIVTRCHAYELRPVARDVIEEYLEEIVDEEKLAVPGDALAYIASECEGSVRQALVMLSAARGCKSRKEAYELLRGGVESTEIIDFVRALVDGKGASAKWEGLIKILSKQAESMSAEGVRLVVVNYLSTTLLGTKDERRLPRLLRILDAFSEPYRSNEKYAPLLLSIGRVLFTEE